MIFKSKKETKINEHVGCVFAHATVAVPWKVKLLCFLVAETKYMAIYLCYPLPTTSYWFPSFADRLSTSPKCPRNVLVLRVAWLPPIDQSLNIFIYESSRKAMHRHQQQLSAWFQGMCSLMPPMPNVLHKTNYS
jgi:hypothetical protein